MKTKKILQLHVNSVFAPIAIEYIEQRRAMGYRCRAEVEYLNIFDRYCIANGFIEPIFTEELWDGWCEKRLHESKSTHHTRIGIIRAFAKHFHSNGLEIRCKFHPLPRIPKTFVPYIFTHEEINQLLSAVDNHCEATSRSTIRHLAMPLLFRMLYTCGLRISDALNLKISDVDLDQGILLILDGKNNKDRLVPMSATLTAMCLDYRSNMTVRNYGSDYFFPAPDRGRYASCTIYDIFRQCLFAAGIGHGGRGNGPRLHDLRHTYAVHTLDSWASQGKDLYVCLPILSTYLGHTGLKSTQQYLRLVPEMFKSVTTPFETSFGVVFPEVCDEEL